MAPRMWARPPFTLPAIKSHQFRALVNWNHAVDLPIRVRVVLALEVVLAVDRGHVHGGHGAEARGFCGRGDARAPIAMAIYGDIGDPAFLETELDEMGQGVVVRGPGAVMRIQVVLK